MQGKLGWVDGKASRTKAKWMTKFWEYILGKVRDDSGKEMQQILQDAQRAFVLWTDEQAQAPPVKKAKGNDGKAEKKGFKSWVEGLPRPVNADGLL